MRRMVCGATRVFWCVDVVAASPSISYRPSAPVVAGAAGLLLSVNPLLRGNPGMLRGLLFTSADREVSASCEASDLDELPRLNARGLLEQAP